jgi:hypothetical protein
MSDKERIEKLVLTLMHLKTALLHINNISKMALMKQEIERVRNCMEKVIKINADQIKLDL